VPPPKHIAPLFAGVADGAVFTITVVVYTIPDPQPEPVPSVTVNEYVVFDVGVKAGFLIADDVASEPAHDHVVAVLPLFGLRFTVPPAHIGPSLVGAAVGTAFTTTGVV
jgi:hypothetical protein